MSLTADQKKHLFIGAGIGMIALAAGHALFGGRVAGAAPSREAAFQPVFPPSRHHEHEHHHHVAPPPELRRLIPGDGHERGEYGRARHRHHHHHHGRH